MRICRFTVYTKTLKYSLSLYFSAKNRSDNRQCDGVSGVPPCGWSSASGRLCPLLLQTLLFLHQKKDIL